MSTKQLYELMILYSGAMAEAEVKAAIDGLKKDLVSLGAEKIEEDYWGRKNFAYKIGPDYSGYYSFFKMHLAPKAAGDVRSKLMSRDKVLRGMLRKVKRA